MRQISSVAVSGIDARRAPPLSATKPMRSSRPRPRRSSSLVAQHGFGCPENATKAA